MAPFRFFGFKGSRKIISEYVKLYQKLPNRYRISLHIDDESVVCNLGRQYGYNVYQLEAQDDDWKEKIIERAGEIRKREFGSQE